MNKNRAILVFSLIIIIANILVYSKTAGYDFVNFDDVPRITENETLKDLSKDNIRKILTTFQLANYQPLVFLTHAIQYKLFKLDPKPYHITNMILHILNGLLVFLLIYYISKNVNIAFIVALFFSLHPVQVETVAWVSELKGLMCTFFYLLSFIVYIHSSEDKDEVNYTLCRILFVIALLCKPIAVTLPIVFIIYDYCYKEKFSKSMVKDKIPLILVSLVFTVIFYFAQESGDAVVTRRVQYIFSNVFFGFYNIGFYLIKLIFPKDLSVHYGYIYEMQIASANYFIALTSISALIVLIAYIKRINRAVLFGILFFLVNLLPILRFIPIGDTLAADRYLYLPIIGFVFAVTTAVYPYVVSRKSIKFIASAVTVLILWHATFLTGRQLDTWQSSFTLWTNVQKSNKDHYNAHLGIGNFFMEDNEFNAAKLHFFKALEHDNPVSQELALYNLGLTGLKEGDYPKAKEYFKELLERFPENRMRRNVNAALFLCAISVQLGQSADAEVYYMAGLQLSMEFRERHLEYAEHLRSIDRIEEANYHINLSRKYSKVSPRSMGSSQTLDILR